jgi:hypothetical protein
MGVVFSSFAARLALFKISPSIQVELRRFSSTWKLKFEFSEREGLAATDFY